MPREPFRTANFPASEPISTEIVLPMGDIAIHASARADVEVQIFTHGHSDRAQQMAGETEIDFSGGHLTIRVPRQRSGFWLFGASAGLDVIVGLPLGSRVHTETSAGDITLTGELVDVRAKTSLGDVSADVVADGELTSAAGDVRVQLALGECRLVTSAGDVRVGRFEGQGAAKTSGGKVRIEDGVGQMSASSAAGDVVLQTWAGELEASTSAGDVKVRCAHGGSITARTAMGDVKIGVPHGTAAWVDASTSMGDVHQDLAEGEPDVEPDHTVEIHASTKCGDIRIKRFVPSAP